MSVEDDFAGVEGNAGVWSVTLASTSRANDAALRAAADIARIAATLDVEFRLVGGNAVTLLTAVHQVADRVPTRETADADFAAGYDVVADPRLLRALLEAGYEQEGGNRFRRLDPHQGDEMVIDVLAPSYEARLVPNQQHGELTVDEVPGVAFALQRPSTLVDVTATLTTGATVSVRLPLPDVVSALCLKAYAYGGRFAARDALDVWRLLEAAHAAGVRSQDWPTSATGRDAARILGQHFGRVASAGPTDASTDRRAQARIRALVVEVVGPLAAS